MYTKYAVQAVGCIGVSRGEIEFKFEQFITFENLIEILKTKYLIHSLWSTGAKPEDSWWI